MSSEPILMWQTLVILFIVVFLVKLPNTGIPFGVGGGEDIFMLFRRLLVGWEGNTNVVK